MTVAADVIWEKGKSNGQDFTGLGRRRRRISKDPLFYTIIEPVRAGPGRSGSDADRSAKERSSRNIKYAPALHGHSAASEAKFLLMRIVSEEHGYRRYEWKSDALNAPSRAQPSAGFSHTRAFSGRPSFSKPQPRHPMFAITVTMADTLSAPTRSGFRRRLPMPTAISIAAFDLISNARASTSGS